MLLETLANKIARDKGFLLAHGFRGSLGPSYQNILAVGMCSAKGLYLMEQK